MAVGAVFALVTALAGVFLGAVAPWRSVATWVDGGYAHVMASPSAPAAAPAPTGPPTRVRIPRIGVDSALLSLGLDAHGALQAPPDYDLAGWYADGTVPGEIGPAVIAGHVDSFRGKAVFFRLHELHEGDQVQVQRGQAWVSFLVVRVDRYAKNAFPTAQVYGPTPDAQLRLITCGGAFDPTTKSYVDNIVVYAVEAA
jgi:LPXTG-site transpeptidase (sortase) family protein